MKMRSVFLCLPVVFLLSGCAGSPSATSQPEMTFADLQPFELKVAKIEVRDDYKPPMKAPNVEHSFPVPPYISAENLLKKQLVAAGGGNVLRVIIKEASVVREELPVTGGFWGAFKHEPAERLKAQLIVGFELAGQQAPDIVTGTAEVTAKRSKTLMEDASAADRDSAYFALTEELMHDLNKGLVEVVAKSFGKRG
ncbi:MAG: hypothetical protein K8R48_07805 [Alphaproteobacteria bacterium]|nr:hypothetical protein [Alphaproteobacteria bacterium]